MAIPVAVSPSTKTPGVYLTVDLLAGAIAPGGGTLRSVIVAPKSASGDLTVDTEVRVGAGEASASTAFGPGTQGHLMAKLLYQEHPTAICDFIAPTAGAGQATLDVTAGGSPTSNQTVDVDICGRTWEVAWLAAETADEIKTKIINSILARTDDLPVTASTGGVGIVTIDAKATGNWGNDVLVKMKLRLAQTGTETLTGAVTWTNLASGSADPDLTTALTNLAGTEYHFMVLGLSNTDVANIGSTNNVQKTVTHIDLYNTGLGAKLQQLIAGYTGAQASLVASTPSSNSFENKEYAQALLAVNGRSLPCELAAREAGGRLAAESLDPAANRIGEVLDGLVGSYDKNGDKPTQAESEAAITVGISIVSYQEATLAEFIVRPVTTHHLDSAGGADTRLIDVQNVSAAYIIARDLRSGLLTEFPQAKITEDAEAGEDPIQKNVTEERDIKAWLISRMRYWVDQGVADRTSVQTSVDDGTLIVQVNSSDPTQVDIVVPFEIVQPLAKFGLTVQRQPS